MIKNLPYNIQEILKLCSDIAFEKQINLYLVGGVIRDLFLEHTTVDIDICMEFDAIEFAQILENANHAKIIQIHPELHTAKVEFQNGNIIDFASTRCEKYPRHSHLPVITNFFCPLKDDILRRDFTVNSIAISLCRKNYGEIIDYTSGLNDLKDKRLRILHKESFKDDPSRIIRALKYVLRLDFKLEENTAKLMKEYLSNLPEDICYSRIMSEIKQVFEENKINTFEKFYDWKLEKLFYSEKNENYINLEKAFEKFKTEKNYFNIFAFVFANSNNIDKNFKQLSFNNSQQKIITDLQNILNKPEVQKNIDIYNKFNNINPVSIALYYAQTLNDDAIKYESKLKNIKLEISGNDLINMGLNPSQEFKNILNLLLSKKLEGKIKSKNDEINYVKQIAKLNN